MDAAGPLINILQQQASGSSLDSDMVSDAIKYSL